MKYLLDTCVITDFVKNHKETVRNIKKLKPNALCVSVITLSEIEYGVQKIKGTNHGRYIEKSSNLLTSVIDSIKIDEDIAREAGKIRACLAKAGNNIGANDLLIAATAKVHGLTMVTSNVGEYSRVEGLVVENWRVDK